MNTENPLAKRLVDHFGGRPETAKHLGRTAESVRLWLKNGIPVANAIEVEKLTDGLVTAEEILADAKRMQAA